MCLIIFLVTSLLEFLLIIKFTLLLRWDDKTEMELKKGGWEGFDWTLMAQNKKECRYHEQNNERSISTTFEEFLG
jgi:hypothetical protein